MSVVCDNELLASVIAKANLDTLAGALAYTHGQDLHKPGLGVRRRTRLTLTDAAGDTHQLYLKRYGPTPLRQKISSLRTHHKWLESASLEYANILAVTKAGIKTMQALAWEQRHRSSYILVSSVAGEALERCADKFLADNASNPKMLESLTSKLATLAGKLHKANLAHRDLYASHIFLDITNDDIQLSLIDLARIFNFKSQFCQLRQIRWIVKDLAQLKYSMPDSWSKKYWTSFLQQYCQIDTSRKYNDCQFDRLGRDIDRKVKKIAHHDANKLCRQNKGANT